MIKEFPKHITILIQSNGKPREGVLFHVVLAAKEKNDYTLGPFLSDSNGQFELTKDYVSKEISKMLSEFPMDYSSAIDEIKDSIIFQIDGKNTIEKRIQVLSKYYPDNAIELINKYELSINKQFVEDKSIKKELNSRIEIALT